MRSERIECRSVLLKSDAREGCWDWLRKCGLLWDCVELWFGKWGKVWKNIDRILQKDYNDTNYIVV